MQDVRDIPNAWKLGEQAFMAGKPSPVSVTWGNVIRNVLGRKRIVDIELAGHNGRIRG